MAIVGEYQGMKDAYVVTKTFVLSKTVWAATVLGVFSVYFLPESWQQVVAGLLAGLTVCSRIVARRRLTLTTQKSRLP